MTAEVSSLPPRTHGKTPQLGCKPFGSRPVGHVVLHIEVDAHRRFGGWPCENTRNNANPNDRNHGGSGIMNDAPLHVNDMELARRIKSGEGAGVEFKESLQGNAAERVREAICAFANDLPGAKQTGIVIIGLRDDGTPANIAVTDEMLVKLDSMRSEGHILPPPTLLAERRRYMGSDVAILAVLPSDSPPVKCRGAIHVRSGPRRRIASAQDERILNERRRHCDRWFDLSPVPGTGPPDLHRRLFEDEYLPRAFDRTLLQANERSYEERLAATKMICSTDDQRATVMGLLVTGIAPREIIPAAYIQFLRIDGVEYADPVIDDMAADGPIMDTISKIDLKLQSHNRRQTDIVSHALERRTEHYPAKALQELVRNAVMHRTYEGTNAPVRVTWFNDRIEIQNPGGTFGAVSEENFGTPGVIEHRNPNLSEALKVLGYVQKFGIGIPTARRALREAGHPDIEFRIDSTHLLAVVKMANGQP